MDRGWRDVALQWLERVERKWMKMVCIIIIIMIMMIVIKRAASLCCCTPVRLSLLETDSQRARATLQCPYNDLLAIKCANISVVHSICLTLTRCTRSSSRRQTAATDTAAMHHGSLGCTVICRKVEEKTCRRDKKQKSLQELLMWLCVCYICGLNSFCSGRTEDLFY